LFYPSYARAAVSNICIYIDGCRDVYLCCIPIVFYDISISINSTQHPLTLATELTLFYPSYARAAVSNMCIYIDGCRDIYLCCIPIVYYKISIFVHLNQHPLTPAMGSAFCCLLCARVVVRAICRYIDGHRDVYSCFVLIVYYNTMYIYLYIRPSIH